MKTVIFLLLAVALLAGSSGTLAAPLTAVLRGSHRPPLPSKIPTTYLNTEYKLFLPLSINNYYQIAGMFIRAYTYSPGYPAASCVYGYTAALVPSAVYSVTLSVDVVGYSSYTDLIAPALDATLPDQKNPFNYCVLSTHYDYSVGGVKLVSASLNPPNGRVSYPLTITSWMKEGTGWETTISGTLRNDSEYPLTGIRVVAFADVCLVKEADLLSTILQPGEETRFIIYNCLCLENREVEISAQGVAEP